SNVLWNRYPELKDISDYKLHPYITLKSKTPIDFLCRCGITANISPLELLKFPYCEFCFKCFINSKMPLQNLIKLIEKNILETKDYFEFTKSIKKLDIRELGDAQEIFATYYFRSHKKQHDVDRYYSRILGDKIPKTIGREKD